MCAVHVKCRLARQPWQPVLISHSHTSKHLSSLLFLSPLLTINHYRVFRLVLGMTTFLGTDHVEFTPPRRCLCRISFQTQVKVVTELYWCGNVSQSHEDCTLPVHRKVYFGSSTVTILFCLLSLFSECLCLCWQSLATQFAVLSIIVALLFIARTVGLTVLRRKRFSPVI